ncbi:MAG: hypothetical protein WA728_22905 [Xanthobacteraceae bacterium]
MGAIRQRQMHWRRHGFPQISTGRKIFWSSGYAVFAFWINFDIESPAVAKIPINERDVFQRLQRALRAEGKELRIARVDKRKIFGKFYLMGPHGLIDTSVDIEKLAREMKLLNPGETLHSN